MTEDNDFKDIIRARMDATGERYTDARQRLTDARRLAEHVRTTRGVDVDEPALVDLAQMLRAPGEYGGWKIELLGTHTETGEESAVVVDAAVLAGLRDAAAVRAYLASAHCVDVTESTASDTVAAVSRMAEFPISLAIDVRATDGTVLTFPITELVGLVRAAST